MTKLWTVPKALARAAFFAVAGASLVGAVVAQGGRFNRWLDVASHFAVPWLIGSSLGLAWALAGERGAPRRVLLGIGVAGMLASGALIAPEFARPLPAPAPPGSPYRLRLIQFNTWERLADPTPVANWIAGQDPDVVAIEDITGPLRRDLIARGFRYTRGMEAVAIFSRRPRLPAPFLIVGSAWPALPKFARATFAAPDGAAPFTVVATHLTWPTRPGRWSEGAALAAMLDRYAQDRLIVAGDFNLTPWSFTLRGLDRRFGLARRDRAIPTWPAALRTKGVLVPLPAVLPLDHVYAGKGWRVVRISRGPRLGSDHYPLVVDLALTEPVGQILPAGPPTERTGSR